MFTFQVLTYCHLVWVPFHQLTQRTNHDKYSLPFPSQISINNVDNSVHLPVSFTCWHWVTSPAPHPPGHSALILVKLGGKLCPKWTLLWCSWIWNNVHIIGKILKFCGMKNIILKTYTKVSKNIIIFDVFKNKASIELQCMPYKVFGIFRVSSLEQTPMSFWNRNVLASCNTFW